MENIEFKTTHTSIQRFTAYKVWLSDLKEKEFKQEAGMPAYIDINGRKVSRVNIVASVVDKFESENYASLTLDDGSAQLRLKAFGDTSQLKNINTGDIILTISRLRNYNNETYLLPEIIRKVDSKQALLRKLELIIEHGKRETRQKTEQETTWTRAERGQAKLSDLPEETEKLAEQARKEKVRILISKLDEGEGVELTQLQEKFQEKEKLTKVIQELLSEGEAYEPRPGKIKLI